MGRRKKHTRARESLGLAGEGDCGKMDGLKTEVSMVAFVNKWAIGFLVLMLAGGAMGAGPVGAGIRRSASSVKPM